MDPSAGNNGPMPLGMGNGREAPGAVTRTLRLHIWSGKEEKRYKPVGSSPPTGRHPPEEQRLARPEPRKNERSPRYPTTEHHLRGITRVPHATTRRPVVTNTKELPHSREHRQLASKHKKRPRKRETKRKRVVGSPRRQQVLAWSYWW